MSVLSRLICLGKMWGDVVENYGIYIKDTMQTMSILYYRNNSHTRSSIYVSLKRVC